MDELRDRGGACTGLGREAVTGAQAMTAREILNLERTPAVCLAARVKREAKAAGILVGSELDRWSKAELVAHLVQTENARRRLGVMA